MNLNEIVETVVDFLIDRKIISAMYQATAVLEVRSKENLTEILTAIRSIKGVTVVTMIEPHAAVSDEKHKAIISVKFIPAQGIPLKNYLHSLKVHATNIPGVFSLKVRKVEPMKGR